VAHESQLHRVPDEIGDETAVLVDPIAGALHAVLRRKPTDQETVLIVGDGLVAMGVAACIRALAVDVACWPLAFSRGKERQCSDSA